MVGRRKSIKRHYVPPPPVENDSDSEPQGNIFVDNEPPAKRLSAFYTDTPRLPTGRIQDLRNVAEMVNDF